VSRTADGAAFCRLVEQSQPPGLRQFTDPVVGRLMDPMLAMMAGAGPLQKQVLDSLAPGAYGGLVMRTRYIDDVVRAWARAGVDQVVVLGAGLDTRAYRLHELAATTVFEVDLPDIQRRKQRRLRGVPRCARDVRFVPVDLTADRLDAALGAAGFDGTTPALFVWEGVTQYLSEAAVRSTLRFVGGSCSGSGLVFTYVLPGVIRDQGHRGWSPELRAQLSDAEPWLFGLEPRQLAGFLAEAGLDLLSDIGGAEYEERYLAPIGRHLDIDPGERVAVATTSSEPPAAGRL